MAEYAVYPLQNMKITQRHDQGNHLAHWYPAANVSDKPWDEAGKDSGREYFVPGNDFRVVEILGLDTSSTKDTTNSVRLESVNPLKIPYQDEPVILEVTLTHMNEDNLKQVHKGQIIHKDEKILLEGTDGLSTGNHFHMTANKDKYYGFKKNSNGKWCFVYEKSLLPPEAFYLDKERTNVINANGYEFKEVPQMARVGTPVPRNTKVDQIEVLPDATVLRARKEPGLNGEVLGYINVGIYDIEDTEGAKDGYDWYKVQGMWIAYSPDWEVIYPKEEPTPVEIQEAYMTRILEHMPEWLESVIER